MSNVPDYQGMFLRGLGGNSAKTLGELQKDAIRNITGFVSGTSFTTFGGFMGALYDYGSRDGRLWSGYIKTTVNNVTYTGQFESLGSATDDFAFDASRVVPTAEENRPVNKAVRYMIKAK